MSKRCKAFSTLILRINIEEEVRVVKMWKPRIMLEVLRETENFPVGGVLTTRERLIGRFEQRMSQSREFYPGVQVASQCSTGLRLNVKVCFSSLVLLVQWTHQVFALMKVVLSCLHCFVESPQILSIYLTHNTSIFCKIFSKKSRIRLDGKVP